MKYLSLILILFTVSSQAQVLGELTGEANAFWTYEGQPNRFENCQVAMNIRATDKRFAIEYSLFDCGALGQWNEFYDYQILNNNLVLNNKIVGKVNSDGSIEFSTLKSKTITYYKETRDYNCNLIFTEKKQLLLNSTTSYTFKKSSDHGYLFKQTNSTDNVVYDSDKNSQCKSKTILTKKVSTMSLEGFVK